MEKRDTYLWLKSIGGITTKTIEIYLIFLKKKYII